MLGLASGCAALSGISDLEVVDCVGSECDAGFDTSVDVAPEAPIDSGADTLVDSSRPDADAPADGDAVTDTGPEAAPDVLVCPETGTDAKADADASADAGPCTGVSIPTTGGSYCIDATEVTNAQYGAFLAKADVCAQPSFCAWNTSFVPASAWPAPSEKASHPVTYVDWCDAYAYCASVGKRLCGRIGGGSNPVDAFNNANASQCHRACSFAGARTYPYGDAYDKDACNGGDLDLKTTTPVGSRAACVGGYPGLFDMSGNVWEWEDSCTGSTGAGDQCRLRGGAYNNTSAGLACAVDFLGITTLRSKTYNNVGFRCCGP
ncbi:MAG: SUMF1/EgtB/PvdO family nonheme iron enzyme [Deltaproteobacteria bacterium]|nr:SUMF1/EgtB/PvdO family nonheme iron enzyme [Deltaproteobacteria bacterium]